MLLTDGDLHTAPSAPNEAARLRRKVDRERTARLEAEAIAERGLRTLYEQQRQAQLLEQIATAANENSSVEAALHFALSQVCAFTGWPAGHACLVEPSQPHPQIRPTAIWHAHQPEYLDAFMRASESTRFPDGVGLPGRVLHDGKPAWIVDLEKDGNFPRIDAARQCGLRAAYAFPVLVRSEVVAILEFFNDRTLEPDPVLLRLMSQIGLQLGRVVERRRAEDKLLHDASHDALTRLPNRALFLDRLTRAIAARQRDPDAEFAVLFIDLDQFKIANDSLGHAAGDELLMQVAERLQSSLRRTDLIARGGAAPAQAGMLLARLGGDEFTVLLAAIRDPADAVRVAERLQDALRAPFRLCGQDVYTGASIGIAMSGNDCASGGEILRNADLAMYRAKRLGKGRCELFDADLHRAAMHRLRMETDLRHALANDEFVLHYQPIVSLATKQTIGFEALVRWEKPGQGLLHPGDFIQLAEDTGLIVFLGRWVLHEACRTGRQWQRDFPDLRLMMSVNISARQFQQPEIVAEVRQALEATGFDPQLLRLEITESLTMGDAGRAVRILTEIKQLGVLISVDDFGTGFSSLSYLHRLPIDVLKIDRSFISDMEGSEESRQIVRTIMNLAQSLELQVIAEGTEAEAQVAQLDALGCQFAQGYYFSKPLDATAAQRLLGAQRQSG